MMDLITAIFAIAAPGLLLTVCLLLATGRRVSLAETSGLSFLLGAGITSLELFAFHALNVDLSRRDLMWLPMFAALLSAAALYLGRAALFEQGKGAMPGRKFRNAVIAVFVLQLALAFLYTLPQPVYSHDAVANYALKAKMFYFSHGIPAGFFGLPESAVAHPDYPLMLPFLMTFVYEFTGFNDGMALQLIPVFYSAFALVFYSGLKKLFGGTYALIAAFVMISIPQVFNSAVVVHTDLILTAYVTTAFVYFFSYAVKGDGFSLAVSPLLAGFALWVKNEAVVFAAAYFIMLAYHAFMKKRGSAGAAVKTFLLPLITVAVIAGPWFLHKAASGGDNSDVSFSKVTYASVMANVKDIPILLDVLQQQVFGPKKWNILWVAFFAVLVWKRKDVWKGGAAYAALPLLLLFAAYFAGYMATTGANLYFYAHTTLSRFMIHFTGLAVLLTAALVYNDVKGIFPGIFGDDNGR